MSGWSTWRRSADSSIESRFPSVRTILHDLASTSAWSRASKTRSSASIERCPSGKSIQSRRPLGKGVVLEGVFVRLRGFCAPLTHWMRIAPPSPGSPSIHRRSRESQHCYSGCQGNDSDHRNNNESVRCRCGCSGGTRSGSCAGRSPACKRLVARHRRSRLHGADGAARRELYPASALRLEHQARVRYGNWLQAVSLLVQAASRVFAVLPTRIHERVAWSNRDTPRPARQDSLPSPPSSGCRATSTLPAV